MRTQVKEEENNEKKALRVCSFNEGNRSKWSNASSMQVFEHAILRSIDVKNISTNLINAQAEPKALFNHFQSIFIGRIF